MTFNRQLTCPMKREVRVEAMVHLSQHDAVSYLFIAHEIAPCCEDCAPIRDLRHQAASPVQFAALTNTYSFLHTTDYKWALHHAG